MSHRSDDPTVVHSANIPPRSLEQAYIFVSLCACVKLRCNGRYTYAYLSNAKMPPEIYIYSQLCPQPFISKDLK